MGSVGPVRPARPAGPGRPLGPVDRRPCVIGDPLSDTRPIDVYVYSVLRKTYFSHSLLKPAFHGASNEEYSYRGLLAHPDGTLVYRRYFNNNVGTVEPLTNDHPHQRPSLSYDHISCDGQWFLFVYESLTSDHPSYTTTPM